LQSLLQTMFSSAPRRNGYRQSQIKCDLDAAYGGPGPDSNEALTFPLYSKVDFVGLDMYPSVVAQGPYTTAEVRSSWTLDPFGNNLTAILDHFFSTKHIPVYLTEFGSPATVGGNLDRTGPGGQSTNGPDPNSQAVLMQDLVI
jgi:hypothetical protein